MTSPDGQTIGVVNVAIEPDTTGFRQEAQRDLDAIEQSLPEVTVFVQPELTGVPELMGEIAALDRSIGDIQFGVQPTLTGMGDLLAEIAVAKAALADVGPSQGVGLQPLVDEVAQATDSITHNTNVIRDAFSNLGYNPNDLTTVRVLRDMLDSVGRSATNVGRNIRDGLQTPILNAQVGASLLADTVRTKVASGWERVKAVTEDALNPTLGFNFFEAFTPGFDRTIVRMTQLRNAIAIDLASAWDQVSAKAKSAADAMRSGLGRTIDRVRTGFDSLTNGVRSRFLPILDNVVVGMRLFGSSVSNAFTGPVDRALTRLQNFHLPTFDLSGLARATDLLGRFVGSLSLFTKAQLLAGIAGVGQRLGSLGSTLSGLSAVLDSVEQAREILFGLFTNLPNVAAATTGILGASAALINLTGGIVGLIGSFAQAIPILLSLPGVAIGVGTMVAAFKDFAKVLPDVQAQLKTLQPLISQNFWNQAAEPIRNLASVVLPQLTAGFGGVATTIGNFVAQFANTLSGQLDGGVLTGWFNALQASVVAFQPAIEQLVGIFITFGNVGSAMLVPLANLTGELVARFDAWFEGLVAGAGGIQAFADQTVAAFGGIIETIIQIGNIFGGVFQAATAAGVLSFNTLSDRLANWAEVLHTDEAQSAMTGLFDAAQEMFSRIATIAGPAFGDALKALSSGLTSILPIVGNILGTIAADFASIVTPDSMAGLQLFIAGIAQGVSSLAPAFQQISPLILALGPALGALASGIGASLGALAPSIVGIVTALTPVIELLGTGLTQVITAVSPAIQQLHDVLANALANPALQQAIQSIITAIISLVPILTPIIALAGQLLNAILPIVSIILTALMPVIGPLVDLVTQIATTLSALLAPILTALGPIFGLLAGVITQVVLAIVPFIQIALDLINAILVPLMPVIIDVINLALVPLMAAFQVLLPVVQLLGTLLQWVVENVIVPIIMPIIQQLASFLDAVLKPAISAIGDIFKATWDLVKGVWDAFSSLFQGDVAGFITKIQGAFSGFRDTVWNIFKDLGSKIWQAIVDAWVNMQNTTVEWIGKVVDAVTGLPGRITSGLGDLSNLLRDAGQKVISGLISGIQDNMGWLGSVLGGVGSFIVAHKGPPKADAVMLFDAGQLIIDGLIDGMESRYKAVKKSLTGLSSSVEGTGFTIPVRTNGLASLAAMLNGGSGGGSSNTFNYYAAPGSSMNSQEDLFSALGRARAGW